MTDDATAEAASDRPISSGREGIVMVFTGDGWGKSAAAIGYGVRARGMGWSTTVVQFLKGRTWNAPEITSAEVLGIDWPVLSARLTWAPHDLAELSERAWGHAARALTAPGPSLVVLDELTHAIEGGWLEVGPVVDAIAGRARLVSVIATGNAAPGALVQVADTVTTFELTKHQSKKGILGL